MTKLKYFIFLSVAAVLCLGLSTFVQGATHTLQDFGLSPDAAKYFTPAELKTLQNSQTLDEFKADIEKNGTPAQKKALKSILATNPPITSANPLSGTVDCFDYYHFGSVQADIAGQSFALNAGNTLNLKGSLINSNSYPIVNGSLYVKIFKLRGTATDANGPDVVDQFFAVKNVSIPAQGKIPVAFSWKIPTYSFSGDYQVATYFIVGDKFNLLGLSFTDDVIGNIFNFKVYGEDYGIKLDKTGVQINDKSYVFAAFPPNIPVTDPAVVVAKVENTTKNDETVNVVWKLYKWDAASSGNLIRTVKDRYTVKAGSSGNIQFTVKEATEPVYYVVGELSYRDAKSIIDARFVRPGVEKIRLNFPSVTSFPLKKDVTSSIFSCLHNSGNASLVPNGKMLLRLTDNYGQTISEYTYDGSVTGAMMAAKSDFKPKQDYDQFVLTAQLWQADKLVDESTLEYDCNKIDPKLCSTPASKKTNSNLYVFIILLVAVFLVVCAVAVVFLKKNQSEY